MRWFIFTRTSDVTGQKCFLCCHEQTPWEDIVEAILRWGWGGFLTVRECNEMLDQVENTFRHYGIPLEI